jgi:glucosylceramidase
VSVQNEPAATQRWDSCVYSAEEERDFVRDHLGPALHAAGLADVRIVVWDHNRDLMVDRAAVIYGDAEAARYVWGTGFHWYGEDHFDHVQLVHDAWPAKQLLFTEGCQEGGPHHGSWDLGERYARSIINDLNRWTVGWIDWNLLLDETGGPNHVGNLCSAPVMADRAAGSLMHQSSFWYLGHFSRFIRPGARRVLCASTRNALEATAFVNPDGSRVVVAMNRQEAALPFALRMDGQAYEATLPPRSIATLIG